MEYRNYNPRLAALTQARTLLTTAARAAMADGALPQAELPEFIVEIPADVKTATGPATWPWPARGCSAKPRARSPRPSPPAWT